MTNKEIYNTAISSGMAEARILGVFTIQKKTILVYIPTFEELCTKSAIVFYQEENNNYYPIDIRGFFSFLKTNYEKYQKDKDYNCGYINPKYHLIFNHYIINNGKTIDKAKELLNKAKELLEDTQFTILLDTNKELTKDEAIDKGLVEIFKLSYSKDNSFNIFLDNLTNRENAALRSIVQEIKSEGNISLSKMVEKYSISRPVYDKLIGKLSKENIAEVVAQGAKGTYIKIIDPELKVMISEKRI